MAESISLAEIKSLLLHILDALNVAPTTTGTASTMIALKELSDDGNSAVLTELPPGAFATILKDTLVLSTPAPVGNPHAPMYLCCTCSILNIPPPHEPNLYYVVTKGLAVGVIQGVPGEHAVIAEFNEALAKGNVKILPPA